VTTASQHARHLLAAIIPGRTDLLDRALRDLTPEQIPDLILSNLFRLLEVFYEKTEGIMSRRQLTDLLTGGRYDSGTIAAYQEKYDELHDLPCDEVAFRWAIDQIRDLAADRATKEALTQAMGIITQGLDGEDGVRLRGHADARAHVLTRFADIDRSMQLHEAPEGDIRAERAAILADYAKQAALRASGQEVGIQFGVRPLDDKVDGLHRGELILIVGYTSDGKTSLCVQLAWSAVVEQQKNVLFLTTETVRDQVRRRILARHSCLPIFGPGDGLNSRDIKHGTLSPADQQRFLTTVDDFHSNPGYGKSYVAQVPRGASMSYVESKIMRVSRTMHIDLVIMDYLALLRPERKRTTVREELAGTLIAAKQLSTTVNDGEGVPFLSPWQVSRAARVEAEQKGSYSLSSTSETSETSNSADTVIGLLAPFDNQSRLAKVKGQVLKHRDGEKANGIDLYVDYATSRFDAEFQQRTRPDAGMNPLNIFG
jgi:replicative DNA helicase